MCYTTEIVMHCRQYYHTSNISAQPKSPINIISNFIAHLAFTNLNTYQITPLIIKMHSFAYVIKVNQICA